MTHTAEPRVEVVDLAREPDFTIGEMVIRPCASEIVVGGVQRRIEPRVMQLLVPWLGRKTKWFRARR